MIKIRQTWRNVEVQIKNPLSEATPLYVTLYNVGDRSLGSLKPGEEKVCLFSLEEIEAARPLGGSWIGDKMECWLKYASGSGAGGTIDKSNIIIYQSLVIPTEVIGAGIGALTGIPVYLIAKKSNPKNRAMIAIGATIVGAVIGGAVGYLTAKQ